MKPLVHRKKARSAFSVGNPTDDVRGRLLSAPQGYWGHRFLSIGIEVEAGWPKGEAASTLVEAFSAFSAHRRNRGVAKLTQNLRQRKIAKQKALSTLVDGDWPAGERPRPRGQ